MKGSIRWNQYGADAVLESKGEMSVREVGPALLKNERQAKALIDAGWPHVIYGMKKYNARGELSAVDFMVLPMTEEAFYRVTKKMRATMIYALHRR